MSKKTFLVLGLGIFGSTIAKQLYNHDQDVIAVDKDMSCVERISNRVSHAAVCDFTDINQLKALGVDNVDVAIIGVGSELEESVLATMNLKELKIPYIVAKARNKKYAEILLKLGVDRVVNPDKEIGIRTAKTLLASNIVDLIEVDDFYNIVEIKVNPNWVGKNLIELDLRRNYNINVLGIRPSKDERLMLNLDPNVALKEDSQLLIIADHEILQKLDSIT